MLRHVAVFSFAIAFVACDPNGCGEPEGPDDPDLGPTPEDLDGDGVLNNEDDDIDGDQVPNNLDEDIDGDGQPNIIDDDVDGDGVLNADDEDPFGTATGQEGAQGDLDGDGLSNSVDSDDDNNNIPDGVEDRNDCNGDGTPEPEGEDCDGYCFDVEGGFQPCNDGAPPGSGIPDSDGDGVPDPLDGDDDGDGIPDGDDPNPDGDDPPPPDDPPPGQCVDNIFDVNGSDSLPPQVLLVVDKSGSMNDPAAGFGDRKWDQTRTALNAVVTSADAKFGLMLYPNGNASDDVCREGNLRVDVGSGTGNAIVGTLNNTEPGGGTPTAVTLAEARDVMNSLDAANGTRAVIIATDGGPNCNGNLNGNTCRCVSPNAADCQSFSENCLDDVNAIGAAAQLNAAGFPLFVVGIPGAENFTDVLNAMANAGGTGEVFNATTADDLAQRIEDITQILASCRFVLQQNLAGATNVTVTVDGVPVPENAQNGYTISGDVLEFHGASCDDLQAGAQAGATISAQICPG